MCDSCADLPRSLTVERGIGVIPLSVTFGQEMLRDGVDITADEFYTRLQQGGGSPSTSQINPGQYLEAFNGVPQDEEVVYVGLSSGLSGSLGSALIATADEPLHSRVHLVDSLGASMGQGLMVLHAADLADRGASAEEIVASTTALRERVCHVFTLDTLDYALKGGRFSALTAMAAKLLGIKPVLDVDMSGHLIPIDKVRGRKRSIARLFEEVDRLGTNLKGSRVGISHAAVPEEAAEVAERFKTQYGVGEVVVSTIGPVIGSHTGPGCIAIFFEGPAGRGQ
ncbi:MAG: DegV family protein [Mycobacterium leprae]